MIESVDNFFARLREASAQAYLGDEVTPKRILLNDLVVRLDSIVEALNPSDTTPITAALPAAAAVAATAGVAAEAAVTADGPSPHGPPSLPPSPPPPAGPSAEELNSAEQQGPAAAPLRLPPGMRPGWLYLTNLQLYYLRNQPLERIARRLLEAAVGPAASAGEALAAPWAAVGPLAAAFPDAMAALLERRLTALLTSRVHTLVGCFDTVQQLYDATCMAALPPEVRQAGMFVVMNTSEAAMRAQVSLLQDKLLADPVLSTEMPITRQDLRADRAAWDWELRFMSLRDILRACVAAGGPAPYGGVPYDLLTAGPLRERVDAAVAAACSAASLPAGFVLPQQIRDAALAAASRSLLLLHRQRDGDPAGGPAGAATTAVAAAGSHRATAAGRPRGAAAGRPRAPGGPPAVTFTGAQTPYSVTVMGSHNAYLYGEHRKQMQPLDAALAGGDAEAPPELVPLGCRPGVVVRAGRLQPGAGYGAWNAESQLALNALGTLSAVQFCAAAAAAAARSRGRAQASTPGDDEEEEEEEELPPPLMNGLNVPVLVLSGGLTSTPIHVEDLALPAINANLGPAAKVWDVARLDRVGRDPVIAAVLAGGGGGATAGAAEALFRLRNKQDFRDLLELGREAGWPDGAVVTVVQQPGMRVVTVPGYVWHNTVSAGAGVALAANWMELPEQPAGAWRAHFDAALEEMSDFASRVQYDTKKMGWMAGTLQLLDSALGAGVRAHLSPAGEERLGALQAALARSTRQTRKRRR